MTSEPAAARSGAARAAAGESRRRRALSALVLSVVAVALTALRAPSLPCGDLCSYYSAGLLLREGDPASAYDPAALERRHRAVHDVGQKTGPFLYSPLYLLPSALLAGEPLPQAIAAARIAGEVALAAGLFAVLLLLDGLALRLLVAAAFALSHAAWVQLIYGNWSFLLFALSAAVLLALCRSGSRRAAALGGVAAALALHLKPFVLFALVPAAAARRRLALATVALAVLFAGLALPFTGLAPWERFASFLAGRGSAGVTPFYSKSSLAANLARLETEPREWVAARAPVESLPVRAVFWLALPLLAFASWRLRDAPAAAFAFGIAWVLLFVPQIWEHTEILLFAALPALERRRQIALALVLAATAPYNAAQQQLLTAALHGTSGPGAARALLWLYPAIHLFVLSAAWRSADSERVGTPLRVVPAVPLVAG